MSNTVKASFTSVLPSIAAPKIKRKDLRKYSWLPDVFRVKGSILGRIIGPVLTVTLFSALVCYASTKGYKLVLINSIVPLLSVVVGLILVFRTSYDRYWEGRKSFAALVSHVRNLSRMIWVNVAIPPTDPQPAFAKGKTPTTDVTHIQLRKRKIDALHLALSFVFSTKHYLRGEDGVNYADYHGVLPASFARFDEVGYTTQRTFLSSTYSATRNDSVATSRENTNATPSGRNSPDVKPDATKRIRVKRSKQQILDHSTPLLQDTHRSVEFHPFADQASLPLPLIIAHELGLTLHGFRRNGFLETVGPAGLNGLTQIVSGLVDQLTALERVANTPIPISYAIHLKQCVTLYLFALPMTLVHDLGWATIPVVTAVAFTFMGIEGIADEIEMPFGNDERDLPLDRYCQDLKEEIFYIIERLPEGGEGLHGYDDGEGDD
ncbi:Bestrophin, RFP-TM, chloride channel-domain-containing protein [Flammula alnicola]|nr:Bestrophin, RFP-TM, chloride channel-domain-containing protein [Flammula alnicola]